MKRSHGLLVLAWLASLLLVYALRPGSRREVLASSAHPNADLSAAATQAHRAAVQKGAGAPAIPGKAKPDVSTLVAQVLAEMRPCGSSEVYGHRSFRALAPLADLDQEQLPEALRAVERLGNDRSGVHTLYTFLLTRWAETDGLAALAYGREHLGRRWDFPRSIAFDIAAAWGVYRPEEALRWLQAEPKKGEDDLRDRIIEGVYAGLAAVDLETTVRRISTGSSAPQVYATLFEGPALRSRLLKYTATLPPEQRQHLREEMIGDSILNHVEPIAEWLRTLPEEERKPLRKLAGRLLSWDSERATRLWLEDAPPEDRPGIYEQIVTGWNNPGSAGQWLAKQPPGPELDEARVVYARRISASDPSAALGWAKGVQNEERRLAAVREIYEQWHARDAAAAEAALKASGLSEDNLKMIRAFR